MGGENGLIDGGVQCLVLGGYDRALERHGQSLEKRGVRVNDFGSGMARRFPTAVGVGFGKHR
jgi:hypothetical protein